MSMQRKRRVASYDSDHKISPLGIRRHFVLQMSVRTRKPYCQARRRLPENERILLLTAQSTLILSSMKFGCLYVQVLLLCALHDTHVRSQTGQA